MDFNYKPGATLAQKTINETFLRLGQQGDQKDLPALRMELYNVIFGLSKLIDLIHDKKIGFPKWMRHFEVLVVKFIQHTSSLNHLAEPVPLALMSNGTVLKSFDTASFLFG